MDRFSQEGAGRFLCNIVERSCQDTLGCMLLMDDKFLETKSFGLAAPFMNFDRLFKVLECDLASTLVSSSVLVSSYILLVSSTRMVGRDLLASRHVD